MEIRISVLSNPVYEPLYRNLSNSLDEGTINFLGKLPEKDIIKLIHSNRCEIALMTPLGYGSLVTNIDLRIIPVYNLNSQNFTNLYGVFFKRNVDSIKKFATKNPDEFISIISKIILSEKYDLHLEAQTASGSLQEMMNNSECVIDWTMNHEVASDLDLSEEWYDFFEIPLPMAFWVCRADLDFDGNLIELIKSFSRIEDTDRQEIIENLNNNHDPDLFPRSGFLMWDWNEESINNINSVLELLFYHQILPVIPEVKIYELENSEELE